MFDAGEYSSNMNAPSSVAVKKKTTKNKIRFSDEQIRSLETIFDTETKIEPKKKVQLARELGLQPRQVAIWFQNKRARWKSKQLETDYSILLANYNNLASRIDTLKKEKQSLLVQLQKLKEIVEKTENGNQEKAAGNSSIKIGDNNMTSEFEAQVKPNVCFERSKRIDGLSDDERSATEYFSRLDEETELLKMVETADSSLTSPEDHWGSLDSEDLLNPPTTSSSQWWDFWS